VYISTQNLYLYFINFPPTSVFPDEKGLSPVNLPSCGTSTIGLKINKIKKLKY
jgi:hypothetical protein